MSEDTATEIPLARMDREARQKIRPAEERDTSAILAIADEVFGPGCITPDDLVTDDQRFVRVICTPDEGVVGFSIIAARASLPEADLPVLIARAARNEKVGEIKTIAIAEHAIGLGWRNALMADAEAKLIDEGMGWTVIPAWSEFASEFATPLLHRRRFEPKSEDHDAEWFYRTLRKDRFLGFAEVGHSIAIDDLEDEFRMMAERFSAPFTAEKAATVCKKLGTHLLKLITPCVKTGQSSIYVPESGGGGRREIFPTGNAGDIPFQKAILRPFEIDGVSESRSIVDHVMTPDGLSDRFLDAFAAVFGAEVLETVRTGLTAKSDAVSEIYKKEVPIIFVPGPGGGDLQITPVSPAGAFRAMHDISAPFLEKQKKKGPKVRRGSVQKQDMGSNAQNISGALGGDRIRLRADLPIPMSKYNAEVYRFVHGGRFPKWEARDVDAWILFYADYLEDDQKIEHRDPRAALDRIADRLICDADRFREETLEDARLVANHRGFDPEKLASTPDTANILLRRYWGEDRNYKKARKALTSSHFERRLNERRTSREG